LKALAQRHLPMALLPQVQIVWGYALSLPPQTSNIAFWCLLDACRSPAPKVQMSPDGSHPEGASLESSCSASSAHGTASTCTESGAVRLPFQGCFQSFFKNKPNKPKHFGPSKFSSGRTHKLQI